MGWCWRLLLTVVVLAPLPFGSFRPWAWSLVGLILALLVMGWCWRLLLTVVVLAPLPFGSFRPWAWSLVGLILALIGLGWCAAVASGRVRPFWRKSLWGPALLFGLPIVWIVIQANAPVGSTIAHPIWQATRDALGVAVSPRISATPEQGHVALIRLLSGVVTFWLCLQYGRDRARAAQLVGWIGIAASLYSLYGLVNFIAGNDYLLIFPRWAYPADVTGPFVNRNSFATYAGLGVLSLSVLLIDSYRRQWRAGDPTAGATVRRVAALGGRPAAYLTGAIICAMALLQSHSRMGLLASGLGVAVLLVLCRAARLIRGWAPIILAIVLAGVVVATSGGGVADRITLASGSDRAELIALTVRAIEAAPLAGAGYGGFATIFPMYRDASLPAPARYDMAHSTYLELAMEIGIPATIAMVAALVWLAIVMLLSTFRRDRDRSLPALGVAASVLVAIHSALDFSVQIPGVQLTFAALLGVGVAQSFSTPSHSESFARGCR